MRKLENKTAIVTGAASGMGEAIAQLFAKEGANVIVSDVKAEGVERVTRAINDAGGKATGETADVSKEEDVKRMIDAALTTYGALDILVNNAGILDDFVPAAELTNELWDRVLAVNLNGPFYACRLAISEMLKKGSGVIINIASIGGFCGNRAGAAYTTSKHALIGLTKNIGFTYAQKGIRCNAIAPGGVNTNIGANMHPNQFGYERAVAGAASMPRMGESIEIAKTALFLACDDSSFVNGSVVTADGGWTAY
ncbi:MAG: glucose 1-dehydrogenase [Bacteroidota bacterium]|jgi:NAD(P)-dependent dehydrogenase (short-subunit alcohol dehydrogenase family)